MRKSRMRGYTLLEIVIAMLLASVVLVGLFNVFSSMVNFQMEALRKGSVTSWTLASLNQMNKEIESANVIYYPNPTSTLSTGLVGCSNWSTIANSALDGNQTTTYFYYCYDNTSGPTNMLRRISASGVGIHCPTALLGAAPACVAGTVTLPGGIASTSNDVIATDVNMAPGLARVFAFDGAVNGIDVNYVVGNPNSGSVSPPSARIVNPQTMTVNTSISLIRPYMNTND